MYIDGKAPGLLYREASRFQLVLNYAHHEALEQLKLLAEKHLECLFLLIKHVIAQVCNLGIRFLSIRAFRTSVCVRCCGASIVFHLNALLVRVKLEQVPEGLQHICTLIKVQIKLIL